MDLLSQCLKSAIYNNNLGQVRQLVEGHGLSFHPNLDEGFEPLKAAIYCKHTTIAAYLIRAGAKTSPPEFFKATALHYAVMKEEQQIVSVLLMNGSDPRRLELNGCSPLHLASCTSNSEIVRMLISHGALVNQRNNSGLTALLFATYQGNADIVRALLENGANYNVSSVASEGLRPISIAAAHGHRDIVARLFDAGYNATDFRHETHGPLHFAVKSDHHKIIDLFLVQNCDGNMLNVLGQTALHTAAKFGKVRSVISLLNWLVDADRVDANGKLAINLADERWRLSRLIQDARLATNAGGAFKQNSGIWFGVLTVIWKHAIKLVAAEIPINSRLLSYLSDNFPTMRYGQARNIPRGDGMMFTVNYMNRTLPIRGEYINYYEACKNEVDKINRAIGNEFYGLSFILDKSTGYAYIGNQLLMQRLNSLKRLQLTKYRRLIKNKIMRDEILFNRSREAIRGLGSLLMKNKRLSVLPTEILATIVSHLDVGDEVNLGRFM